ncbi:MAG: hypothetical protein ABT940_03385, partial [Alphaproteobacteria bacterium]
MLSIVIGTKPSDLLAMVQAGVDMCDCVAPSRLARTGYLYQGVWSKTGKGLTG